MSESALTRIRSLAEDICVRENCRLYDLEFVGQGRQRVLRIYIDKVDGQEESVSLDDCAKVSNGLSLQLDVEDIIPGDRYNLEVSSPGLDRKLSEPWHFQVVAGRNIRIWLGRNLSDFAVLGEGEETPKRWAKCKRIESVLKEVNDGGISMVVDDKTVSIPFGEIEKAKLVVEFEAPQKPQKNNPRKKTQKKKTKKKR